MPNVFEPAASGRSKCRGCSRPIARGELRFGERLPNPFADGEMTIWFHPVCAAYKRPEPLLQALAEAQDLIADRDLLERAARGQLAHRRLPRINGVERAPSGQAKCRSCREPIDKGLWRIRLTIYEEGLFSAAGFIHITCRKAYFETSDMLEPLLHFSPSLNEEDRRELLDALAADADPEPAAG